MSQNNSFDPILDQAFQLFKSKGIQNYEIYLSQSKSLKIEAKNQKVDTLTQAQDQGLSIRVFKDHKVGFSFSTSYDLEAISKAIDTASSIAKIMPADEVNILTKFSDQIPLLKGRTDEEGIKVSIEKKVQHALDLERLTREQDSRITGIRSAAFAQSEYQVALANSFGQKLFHEGHLFSGSISCKAEENGAAQMGGEYQFSTHLNKLDLKNIAKEAAHSACEHLNSKNISTRSCPALIRNNVVADLIDFLSSSFSGDEVFKGKSMLKGKLNEKVFHPQLNLLDDALLLDGYSTRPFDAEGSASQTTKLIENGLFKNLLLDRTYALKLGLKSSANASRSIKNPPSISQTNLYMEAGQKSFNQLLEEIGNGIMITDLMGIHTANPVTGNFSLGATGIMIENGKLTYPVNGFAVAGNVLDLFRTFKSLGSDLKFFGNTGAPSITLESLSVSGE